MNMLPQHVDQNKNKKMIQKMVQLIMAEVCFNLDLEFLKNKLEVTEGGYSTSQTFELVDIRGYKYLDIQAIQTYMEQYFKLML